MTHDTWLVWSHEHDAWWRPGRMGYTKVPWEAGHYPEAEARAIAEGAEPGHETALPARAVMEAFRAFAGLYRDVFIAAQEECSKVARKAS